MLKIFLKLSSAAYSEKKSRHESNKLKKKMGHSPTVPSGSAAPEKARKKGNAVSM